MNLGKVKLMIVFIFVILGLVLSPQIPNSASAHGNHIHLTEIGRYDSTGAEISAYDPATKRLFVTGAGANVEILDLSSPSNPALFKTIFVDATSVAVKNGIVAIAVPNAADNTNNGQVFLYESSSSFDTPMTLEVGALQTC
jgi:hypothetical protein